MKKLGFTLSELIVTLSVVGIVSAITVPMVSGLLPDKDKVNVLKVYKLVNDLNREMLNTPGLYFQSGDVAEDGETPSNQCVGLACDEMPLIPPFNNIDDAIMGTNKYARLLFRHLDINNEADLKLNDPAHFTTTDSIYWEIKAQAQLGDGTNGNPFTRNHILTVDFTRGNDNGGCTFGEANCEKPERFSFLIDTNGKLSGNDPLTRAYLANPHKLNDKKHDYSVARGNAD